MTTKISTKIKILGALLIILTLSVIAITIYLNEKNTKNALVVNIAGKERMLTQKMSKSIFYNYHASTKDCRELEDAIKEFTTNINALRNGDASREIAPAPTKELKKQIDQVLILWNGFEKNIKIFRENSNLKDDKSVILTQTAVESIYASNNTLLQEIEKLVSMYTVYYDNKTSYIKKFQYGSAFVLFFLIVYALRELKSIEEHAEEFFAKSKQLVENPLDEPLKHIEIKGEKEIVDATDTINCFINKINSAVNYSQEALNFSKSASSKLEEITDEFGDILKELNDKEIKKALNTSEDIAIESAEELLNSTKKLENLKNQLDKLLNNCKDIKNIQK